MRVICLASGRGSNFEALVAAQGRGELGDAKVVALGVNRPACGALERAQVLGIPTFVEDHRTYSDRASFEQALCQQIERIGADLIVLAGFMRVLTATFLEGVGLPVINLHPALLPAFPGIQGIQDAYDGGVRLSGCTTHLVTVEVDEGPILMQGLVPIQPTDEFADFKARMHEMEHRLLPATVAALARGDLRWGPQGLITEPSFQAFLLPADR